MLFKSKKSNPQATTELSSPTEPVAPPPLPSSVDNNPDIDSETQFKDSMAASNKIHASFGEIVSLFMQSSRFKSMPLSVVDQLVVPPLMAGQFMIAKAADKKTGLVAPAAAILWASVSEDVDRRLSEAEQMSASISPGDFSPNDWKSGDIPWLIIALGNKRVVSSLLSKMEEKVPKGRSLKILSSSGAAERGA